jgi:hydroxymethylbilane synthase
MRKLVAGSRGSKLALVQTEYMIGKLGIEADIKRITTRGDKILDVALSKVGGKGLFTKEIDDALLNGSIDFAVHSFKDLPTDIPEGITVAAIPSRESPKDALVGNFDSFESLPEGARVGTSSLRRRVQAEGIRPDVEVLDLRGNLDTRVRKLSEGQYDTIIVAEAGLKRLGYDDYHTLEPRIFIPAACQGALAVTAREGDSEVLDTLKTLDDATTRSSCMAERRFLADIEGGCQIPAGIYTEIDDDSSNFYAVGFISSLDGKILLRSEEKGSVDSSVDLAGNLAKTLLDSGGKEIIEDIRKEAD